MTALPEATVFFSSLDRSPERTSCSAISIESADFHVPRFLLQLITKQVTKTKEKWSAKEKQKQRQRQKFE